MEHYFKPLQWDGNYLGKELLIAISFEKKEWIVLEELLEHEQVDYQIIWQSKYNSYVQYDYEPFCQEGFVKNYFIQGEESYLEWLQQKAISVMEEAKQNREYLENCLKQKDYIDDIHGCRI